jgi:hypothetical protein
VGGGERGDRGGVAGAGGIGVRRGSAKPRVRPMDGSSAERP